MGAIQEGTVFWYLGAAVDQFRFGMCGHLVAKYEPWMGHTTAVVLAAAVVNQLFGHDPTPYAVANPGVVTSYISALRDESIEVRRLLTNALKIQDVIRLEESHGIADWDWEKSCSFRASELGVIVDGLPMPDRETFMKEAVAFARRISIAPRR